VPLTVLLPLVVFGIAGLVGVMHLLGYSRRLALTGPEDVARHWRRHWPEDRVLDVTLCRSGGAALVRTAAGPGLLWSFGADTVARRLKGARARPVRGGLAIRLPDFAAPRVRLRMDADEARAWAARIQAEAGAVSETGAA